MGFLDDFLATAAGARLAQHLQSQVQPFEDVVAGRNQPLADRALLGFRAGMQAGPKTLLDTLGLLLEGSGTLTRAGLGAGMVLADAHGLPLPGISPYDKALLDALTAQARTSNERDPSQVYVDAANVTDQMRAYGDTPLAWGLGAVQTLADPSNYVLPELKLGGVGKAVLGKLAPKAPAAAERIAPEVAQLAPETAAKIATSPVAQKAIPAVAGVLGATTGVAPAAGSNEQKVLALAVGKGATPTIKEIQDALKVGLGEAMRLRDYASGKAAVQQSAPVAQQAAQQAVPPQAQQMVARLTGAAGAAPEAAAVKGPLQTIFGQDASVVHSGTYPGLPKSAPAPDVQQAVAQLTGEAPDIAPAAPQAEQAVARLTGETPVPTNNTQEAALAPDATINDKNNAADQNPALPVRFGTPPSVTRLSAALKTAYAGNDFGIKNAIPKLREVTGAALHSDGTWWKNGVDVTEPVLSWLEQVRPTLGNKRKVIDQSYVDLKGTVDQLVERATGSPSAAPGTPTVVNPAVAQLAPETAAKIAATSAPAVSDPAAVLTDLARQADDIASQLLDAQQQLNTATTTTRRARLQQVVAKLNAQYDEIDARYTKIANATGPKGLPGNALLPFATTVGGAAAGAGAGYHQDGVSGALKGAVLGGLAGAGVGSVPYGTLGQTARTLGDIGKMAGRAGADNFANAQANGTMSLKALANDWADDKVKVITGRTLALDEVSNRVKALVSQIPLARINGSTRSIVERTQANGGKVVPRSLETDQFLQALGFDPNAFNYADLYGQGFFGKASHARQTLPPAASAGAGIGYSLLNPATYLTGGLGAAVAGVRGYFRPFTSGATEFANDIQHFGVRDAGFLTAARQMVQDAASEFLGQLQQQGVNTAGLDARGLFTPADVEAIAPGNGAVWQDVLDQIVGTPAVPAVAAQKATKTAAAVAAQPAIPQVNGLASGWVKQVFGDYSQQPKGVLGAIAKVAPFSHYTLGQLPVAATLIAQHPAATLAVAHLLSQSKQEAQREGLPGYLAGTLPVDANTPLIGKYLQAVSGSQDAKGYINILNAISPVGDASGLSVGENVQNASTAYDKAAAILGAIGLRPNPLIQTAAYVLGASRDTAGAQSRFSGIEQALGGPQIPTIKTALDNARQAIGGQRPNDYDPVYAVAQEITLRETGKPLSDPSNKARAIALEDHSSPLYQQALAIVNQGGALKNALSVVSPVTVTVSSGERAAQRQAQASIPRYTQAQIAQAAQVDMGIARQMQQINAAIEAQNPALLTYDYPHLTAQDRQDPRITAFEQKYIGIKNAAPKVYAQLLAEYKQQLGVK